MPEQPFDVRKVIDQSASKTTLQELAKKGIHRVKVLDEQMINNLIRDAVEHILVSKTSHCLYELLLKHQDGELECDFPVIIANHPDLASVATGATDSSSGLSHVTS